ncbi:hypothetical protein ACVBIO_12485, partial [Shewanella sp. 0m-8]
MKTIIKGLVTSVAVTCALPAFASMNTQQSQLSHDDLIAHKQVLELTGIPHMKYKSIQTAGIPHIKYEPLQTAGIPHIKFKPVQTAGIPHIKFKPVQTAGIPHIKFKP